MADAKDVSSASQAPKSSLLFQFWSNVAPPPAPSAAAALDAAPESADKPRELEVP